MTDCCLCVWCRPAPHKRLLNSLFPPKAKGNEPNLLPVNASKLVQYALARPMFLGFIAKDLSIRAKKEWTAERYGFALIALSATEQLVEACGASNTSPTSIDPSALAAFDASVIDVINTAINHPNGEIRAAGARLCGKFISGQDILVDQAKLAEFLSPLLHIIANIRNGAVSAADLAALESLIQLISKSTPQALVDHVASIAPILLAQLQGELARLALVGQNAREGDGVVSNTSALLRLLEECLVHIAASLNPAVASGILAPFLAYFDDHKWRPAELVLRVTSLLGTSVEHSSPAMQSKSGVTERMLKSPTPNIPRTSTYSIPMFVVLLRHLAKMDDNFSALANAFMVAGKTSRVAPFAAASTSASLAVPQLLPDAMPLPSAYPSHKAMEQRSLLSPTPEAWTAAFRVGTSQGLTPDEVAAKLAASSVDGSLTAVEADFTILRLTILQYVQTLLCETSANVSSYSHEFMDVVVPILVEPSERDLQPASMQDTASRMQSEATALFLALLHRTSVPQHIIRLCSDLAEWYLNHVMECASLDYVASGEAAESPYSFHQLSHSILHGTKHTSRRSEGIVTESPSHSILTSPSSMQGATTSRRLSRNIAAALAASALSPVNRSRSASAADGGEGLTVMNFFIQAGRQAVAARLRLFKLLIAAFRHLCTVCSTQARVGQTSKLRLNIPKFITLVLESALVEQDARLRMCALFGWHELLSISSDEAGRDMCSAEYTSWVLEPIREFAPNTIVHNAGESGWMAECEVNRDVLRFPSKQLTRLFSCIFHSLLVALAIRVERGEGVLRYVETDNSASPWIAQEFSLVSMLLQDCLQCFELDALWKTVALAFSLQSAATTPRTGSKATAASATAQAGHSLHATATAAHLSTIEEEDENALANVEMKWSGPWPLVHAAALCALRRVSFALNADDLRELLDDIHQTRIMQGKGEVDVLNINADGSVGAPRLAEDLAKADSGEAEDGIDMVVVAGNIVNVPIFRNLLNKHGITFQNETAADIWASSAAPKSGRPGSLISPAHYGITSPEHMGLIPPLGSLRFPDMSPDEKAVCKLLASTLVVLDKDLVLKELSGSVEQVDRGESGVLERGRSFRGRDTEEQVSSTMAQSSATIGATGVSTCFRIGDHAGPVTVESVKYILLHEPASSSRAPTALDFEKGLDGRAQQNVLHLHSAAPADDVMHALLEPWRKTSWLQVSTDAASYWELEVSKSEARVETR